MLEKRREVEPMMAPCDKDDRHDLKHPEVVPVHPTRQVPVLIATLQGPAAVAARGAAARAGGRRRDGRLARLARSAGTIWPRVLPTKWTAPVGDLNLQSIGQNGTRP